MANEASETMLDRAYRWTRTAALLTLAALACSCAFTRAQREDWMALEPELAPEAVGPGAEWFIRNEQHAQVNAWRWPEERGPGHVYIYVRDAPSCPRARSEPARLTVLDPDAPGWRPLLQLRVNESGVALELEPGYWDFYLPYVNLSLLKRQRENILVLLEPWPERYGIIRTHYSYSSRDDKRAAEEIRRYDERTREMLAERCRRFRAVGRPPEEMTALKPRRD